ncbi:YlaH-like family protein [Ureibacillus sp. MALMAid1270]|uniref:YlaH-like family protein n=1 Tax=Ureibacillus sp. MALMAid1270 TaxID=3411629 RepID=UPI003BA458FF
MNVLGTLNLIQASTPTIWTEGKAFGMMSGTTRYIYEHMPSYQSAGYVVFILVFILSAIVFKLGFAKNDLSLGKNIIIYIFLFLGCIVLTFLALFLPMIEGLVVAALILIIYKTRLWREKREQRIRERDKDSVN